MAAPGINGIAYHGGQDVLQEGLPVSYNIDNRVTQALLTSMPLPTGPWRAVMNGPNAFANECFLDEVAVALKQDPYAFRMSLLSDSDLLKPVVELAATKANWGGDLPTSHKQGLACHTTYGLTAVAMVAEVSVIQGVVRVHKVTCAVDCGVIVNPDMVTQQMEGGIVFGLTSLLKGEITFDKGRVQQSNFHDYPLLQMSEMPVVEVYSVPSTRSPQGVGEMAVPPIVPAVVNAIFAATGKRIRRTPLHPEDLA
jgi:isoquinoline 1-oxidoreductase beta subunit